MNFMSPSFFLAITSSSNTKKKQRKPLTYMPNKAFIQIMRKRFSLTNTMMHHTSYSGVAKPAPYPTKGFMFTNQTSWSKTCLALNKIVFSIRNKCLKNILVQGLSMVHHAYDKIIPHQKHNVPYSFTAFMSRACM